MLTAIKQNVEVMPGGVLLLHVNNLKPYSHVSVSAIIESNDKSKVNLSEMIGSGKGLFCSKSAVDKFIREERDNWEKLS